MNINKASRIAHRKSALVLEVPTSTIANENLSEYNYKLEQKFTSLGSVRICISSLSVIKFNMKLIQCIDKELCKYLSNENVEQYK